MGDKNKYIFIDGFPHTKNFGDALNTPLVEYLAGKKVLPSKNISRFLFSLFMFRNYAVIGSILQWAKRDVEVWGAGYISDQTINFPPSKVYAIRGPLSREILQKHNISCPDIYGDPALLFPIIYSPEIPKKYKLGIIPHYYDNQHPWVHKMGEDQDVLIIDLMVRFDYKKVINQILECEKILSSSLHGVILSDAYQIPNRQIIISNKVAGADFKFQDYFLSVGRGYEVPINPLIDDINKIQYSANAKINLNNLIKVCPFAKDEIKNEMIRKLSQSTKFSHLREENEN